jgi:uncharacterized membrane protein HdeD (DUF308 family)
MARVIRRKAHALGEGATLRLGRPMVQDATSRIWWVTLLRALAAIAFGLLTLVWPRLSAQAMVALFGAYAVFDGLAVFLIAAHATRRRLWLTLAATVSMVTGLVALTQPRIFALLLVRVLGGWLILRGLAEVISAPPISRVAVVGSKPGRRRRWAVLLNGGMSVLFGLGLIAAPRIGALGLLWALGAWAVLHGLLMAPYALSLRRDETPAPE